MENPMANEIAVVDAGLPAVADDSAIVHVSDDGDVANIVAADQHVEIPRSVTASVPQDDLQTFQSFADHMGDVPVEFLERAGEWYSKFAASQRASLDYLDAADRDQMRKDMGNQWGNEYQSNVNLICGTLDALPIGVQEAIESARLDDGKMLLNTRVGLMWLLSMARRPAIDVPAGSDERTEIEELMRDSSSRYYKGPDAPGLQARYRDLIDKPQSSASLPKGAAAINQEITRIETVMREDRRSYNRNSAMQARYLQLIELRDGA
jgi:hypothetical protein